MITTDVGGLPEVVRNRETGLVVSPRDNKALTEAIMHFFAEGLAPHFRQGIQACRNTLSWKQLVVLIEEMIQQ